MEGGQGKAYLFRKHTAPWKKQGEYGCYRWVNLVQLLFLTGLMNKR